MYNNFEKHCYWRDFDLQVTLIPTVMCNSYGLSGLWNSYVYSLNGALSTKMHFSKVVLFVNTFKYWLFGEHIKAWLICKKILY